jgi:hypothetical protein
VQGSGVQTVDSKIGGQRHNAGGGTVLLHAMSKLSIRAK